MNQVIVKCVSNHMNKKLLTEGKDYKAYSHNRPCNPLTEKEWLDLTQEDLLVIVADNGDKISFAKWRFIRADEQIMEGAKFESTLGEIDELEDEFEENNIIKHKELLNQMHELYKRKNADYGSSTNATYELFGDVSYAVRINDKMNRINNLLKKEKVEVNDESVDDTIMDMANYCILWLMNRNK